MTTFEVLQYFDPKVILVHRARRNTPYRYLFTTKGNKKRLASPVIDAVRG